MSSRPVSQRFSTSGLGLEKLQIVDYEASNDWVDLRLRYANYQPIEYEGRAALRVASRVMRCRTFPMVVFCAGAGNGWQSVSRFPYLRVSLPPTPSLLFEYRA